MAIEDAQARQRRRAQEVDSLGVRGYLETVPPSPMIRLNFQFNPAQVSDKRAINYNRQAAPGNILPGYQYTSGGERSLGFTVSVDARFAAFSKVDTDGDGGITPELNKYRALVYPRTDNWQKARSSFLAPGIYPRPQQFVSPPACRLVLGSRVLDVIVTELEITETVFNEKLAPLRADIKLTVVEYVPDPK